MKSLIILCAVALTVTLSSGLPVEDNNADNASKLDEMLKTVDPNDNDINLEENEIQAEPEPIQTEEPIPIEEVEPVLVEEVQTPDEDQQEIVFPDQVDDLIVPQEDTEYDVVPEPEMTNLETEEVDFSQSPVIIVDPEFLSELDQEQEQKEVDEANNGLFYSEVPEFEDIPQSEDEDEIIPVSEMKEFNDAYEYFKNGQPNDDVDQEQDDTLFATLLVENEDDVGLTQSVPAIVEDDTLEDGTTLVTKLLEKVEDPIVPLLNDDSEDQEPPSTMPAKDNNLLFPFFFSTKSQNQDDDKTVSNTKNHNPDLYSILTSLSLSVPNKNFMPMRNTMFGDVMPMNPPFNFDSEPQPHFDDPGMDYDYDYDGMFSSDPDLPDYDDHFGDPMQHDLFDIMPFNEDENEVDVTLPNKNTEDLDIESQESKDDSTMDHPILKLDSTVDEIIPSEDEDDMPSTFGIKFLSNKAAGNSRPISPMSYNPNYRPFFIPTPSFPVYGSSYNNRPYINDYYNYGYPGDDYSSVFYDDYQSPDEYYKRLNRFNRRNYFSRPFFIPFYSRRFFNPFY